MKNWISNSIFGCVLLFIALLVGIAMVLVQGCALDQMIKVQVPQGVRVAIKAPSQIPLRDSEITFDQWSAHVERESERFARNIADAQWIEQFVAAGINTGLGLAEGPLATLPGGALIFGALSGGAGLFMRKPGSHAETSREKEASYKAGLRAAIATLAAGNGGTGHAVMPEAGPPTPAPTPKATT